ncbi:diacylglycerol kinase family protein [Thermoactinomyces sp. CICC 10523]|uniref:diacylglycerol/lipid kinase family protein n=1 Tax=Thermoactinomyces sp. CICC 10523 TaxID=2767428 RepID=UPI0018DE7A09|nr:diacylglycerol kinase family protein [Thermoactinomyces sp. CICC 10523]MBH8599395.1 diacylglycerol kinase family lipid kinase [Thermoactinomyces sp. CICC 10523]
MDKIIFLVNPNAGNKELITNVDAVSRRFQEIADKIEICHTSRPGDSARIIGEQGACADLVIAVGGDGTVHECVNALAKLRNPPLFAMLPGGTCNDFARTLGISQDYREAVEQIIHLKERKVDIGKHGDRYFLNFWGIGLITQVSEEIRGDLKEKFGRLSYYLSAVQTLNHQEAFELDIEADTAAFKGKATMVLVGNGSFIGGVNAYFPQSSVTDGWLDVLIFKEVSFSSFWSMLTSYLTTEEPEGKDLVYFHAKKVRVKTTPPLKVDCDGEKNSYTPVTLSILPGHLRMVVGDDKALNERKGYQDP